MTIDKRRRARQLARKAAKRKARAANRNQQSRNGPAVAGWRVHESYMPDNLFETGLGDVVISRRMGSQFAAAVFLVDTGCLGVKNAFLMMGSDGEYRNMLEDFRQRETLIPVEPECARKLIESAVEYAADLGFGPHKDYRKAKVIFGAIDTDVCGTAFQFGKDGKPFYCSGPSETPPRRERILNTLRKRCGPDGFHFLVGVDDVDFDELEDSDDDFSEDTNDDRP